MRWTLRILTAAALTVCAATAYADPPGRVARVSYASGAVSFAPAEEPERWMQAVLNRPVTGGDRLWVDRDGRAEFQVGATAVRMAPLTNVDVLHLDDDRLQLRIVQGSANVRVRELDADDLVEVVTPAGAVVIRQPGSYRVSVDPNANATRVAVNFGRAQVATSNGDFAVPSGQAVYVSAHAPAAFEIATADEFDRWSGERDRADDRLVSTRYVSPHMTGYQDLDRHGSWRTLPEYGAVWVPARVAPGWAPYRHGHWEWISPWGWTWIDDAPWGFAPFHYGRWVHVHDYWAWAPGPIVRRPVYAPALVGFVGGSGWSVSVTSGPAVGWFPLGWREPYRPWYRASPRYVQNVNVTNVTNVTNIYRNNPQAVTVVPQQSFVSARPIAASRVSVAQADLARAEVIRDRQPVERVRASIAPERFGQRPPAELETRRAEFEARRAERASQAQSDERARPDAERAAQAEANQRAQTRAEQRARMDEQRGRAEAAQRAQAQAQVQRQPAVTPPAPAPTPQPRVAEREQRAEQRDRLQAERRARAEAEQRRAQSDERARPDAERAVQAEANQRAQARAEQRARMDEQRARAEAAQRAQAQQAQIQRQPAAVAAPAAPVAAARPAAAPAAQAQAPAPRPQSTRPQRNDSDERRGPGRRGDGG